MADRKISDLTALTAPASGDYLPIVDISEAAAASKNKRITIEELFRGVPLGTAAAPSIAIEGDENTGIYSPGADQLAISTNGTGRLFVDSSGRVGIGDTPGVFVDINDPGTGMRFRNAATSSLGLSVGLLGGTSSADAYVFHRANGPLIFGTNNAERLRITSTGALNFVGAGTAGSTQAVSFNGSAPVNSLVIDSTGKVGLGTSAPGSLLEVAASTDVSSDSSTASSFPLAIWKGSSVSNGQATGIAFGLYNAINSGITPGAAITHTRTGTNSVGSLEFKTKAGTGTTDPCITRMTIDSSGRVGIGTTSPESPLNIVSSSDATIILTRTASANAKITTTSNGALAFGLDSSGGNTERARIDSSGTFRVKGAGTAGVTDAVQLNGSAPANSLLLDASGRLLVGTSSARTGFFNGAPVSPQLQAEGLGFNGSSIALVDNENGTTGGGVIIGRSRGTSLGSVTILQSGDSIGSVSYQGADGTDFVEAARIEAAIDGTPGANDMPGRLVFSTTADGAASPTERMRITSTGQVRLAGAGITFNGDTAAANELDDYEEGTWTPVFTLGGGSVTYTTQQGRYTKVGRLVTISAFLRINTVSSPSGTLEMNLPFSPAISKEGCICRAHGFVSTLGSLGLETVSTNVRLYGIDASNVLTDPADKLANSCQMLVVFSYTT